LNPEYTLAIGDQLRRLEHETLIMWGRQDPFQRPSYAEQLRAAIPNARVAWIENAAHWVMGEKPAQRHPRCSRNRCRAPPGSPLRNHFGTVARSVSSCRTLTV
jgi:pimeloyl-ACP methyl ester carboxylesterase